MIKFAIPGLYEHHHLNFRLLDLMRAHPEYFYDDVEIEAAYGNFQFCIWDGGRIFPGYKHATMEQVRDIVDTYNNKFGIAVRLIFTSNQLKPEHYHDRFCNMVLSQCENEKNQIVLVDDGLKAYIKENFPKFRYISSTTKCLTSIKDFKEELSREDFDEVCLDYNLNKNMEMLKTLTPEEKTKCEFLINAICPPGCPNRKDHYRLNSLMHLFYGKEYRVPACPIIGNTVDPKTMCYHNNLTPEEILNTYAPMGFQHFKLEGRALSDLENACNYVRYMVKPEFQFLVLTTLIPSGKEDLNLDYTL